MRITLLICGLLLTSTCFARDYTADIEAAQRACSIEQKSQLRPRNGTPSCDKANQLVQLQQMEMNSDAQRERLHTEADVSRETGQPMPSHNFTEVTTNVVNNTSVTAPAHIQARRIYDPETRKSCLIYTDGVLPSHCN